MGIHKMKKTIFIALAFLLSLGIFSMGQSTGADKMKDTASMVSGDFVKPSADELRKALSPLQYKVTQEEGTEKPYTNKYWDNKAEGIYVDIVSGEPLFSSTDKFKSGTGWPSFTQPIKNMGLIEKTDRILFYSRTEVRSPKADSHLGHVFDDGPKDKGGLRYCVNSASLKFVPKGDLQMEGLGQYLSLFDK